MNPSPKQNNEEGAALLFFVMVVLALSIGSAFYFINAGWLINEKGYTETKLKMDRIAKAIGKVKTVVLAVEIDSKHQTDPAAFMTSGRPFAIAGVPPVTERTRTAE